MNNQTYIWGHNRRYNDYTNYIKKHFNQRVQKISINTGLGCPNRDGTITYGGCTYCNNQAFNPAYSSAAKTITQQLNEGIDFFAKKYKTQKYLAYFQSYTNTYADVETLKKLYIEALSHPKVIGLVIATRPDTVDDEKLGMIAELSEKFYIMIEYGVESTNNNTLKLINRGHDYETSVNTIIKTHNKGINVGAHLIIGLPDEDEEQILQHACKLSQLPLTTLKLHQLQIIEGTKMALQYKKEPSLFNLFTIDNYINLIIDFLEILNPDIVVERFTSESPVNILIAPQWGGLKNFEIVDKIDKKLIERNTWQGRLTRFIHTKAKRIG
ncbi:MAG: TIGR01212 family radical SAM protein [Bacteroidales bacterium]|nr:TIGR01212 family radical SAM protein [Bacteroidales bacterium]